MVYCYDANGLETMATPTGLKEMFFSKDYATHDKADTFPHQSVPYLSS